MAGLTQDEVAEYVAGVRAQRQPTVLFAASPESLLAHRGHSIVAARGGRSIETALAASPLGNTWGTSRPFAGVGVVAPLGQCR